VPQPADDHFRANADAQVYTTEKRRSSLQMAFEKEPDGLWRSGSLEVAVMPPT
jgi:hypothetical protein